MKLCWFCGTEAIVTGKLQRSDVCTKCKMSLKCCRNCRFFDPAAPKQCREPAAELVADKDKANFCEYFEFVERVDRPRPVAAEGTRKRFDALFKKK